MNKKISDKYEYNYEKNWADFTVDIHDGWADDVSLVYPENSWRPDDEELTAVALSDEASDESMLATDASHEDNATNDANNDSTKKVLPTIKGTVDAQLEMVNSKTRRKSRFKRFLIIWVILLTITMAIFLVGFNEYLVRYEAAYQQSRPYHVMDDLLVSYKEFDFDLLSGYMPQKPAINEYETESDLAAFMYELLDGKEIAYSQAPEYTEDNPVYYVTADDYIVSTIMLRKSPVESLDYGFPVWYVTQFEYYTEPQYNVRIITPSNFEVRVNDKLVSEDYLISSVSDNQAFEGFNADVALPNENKYQIDDFYVSPTVTAVDPMGNGAEVTFNDVTGFYEVSIKEGVITSELRSIALNGAEAYSNYVAHDLSRADFEGLFIDDCPVIKVIETAVSDNFFANHRASRFENEVIDELRIYSADAFYAEITLDQVITTNWGSEVTRTNHAYYYFVKQDGEWKISNILF